MLTLDFKRLGLRPSDLVLDIGCGFGRHSYEVARLGGRAVAVDLATNELLKVLGTFGAMARQGDLPPGSHGTVSCADALSLPFPDATFDRVIASEVLEHIPNDLQAMAELARVTKPGGTLAVTVPRTGQEAVCWLLSRQYHDTPGGHVRIYRLRQLAGRLRTAGLRPRGMGYAHALHTPYWWLRCLVGPTNEGNPLVRAYRSFLEWDIRTAPRFVRTAEQLLNPVLGKSMVIYLQKPATAAASSRPEAAHV